VSITVVPDAIIDPAYPGFNVMLMGPSGTGKTYAINTLVETGLEVFCLFLEPGLETLVGVYADNNKPIPKNLHWHYLQPKTQGFDQLRTTADMIGKFDLSGLGKMKDMHRSKNNQMTAMYEVLNDFDDQHTKVKYGPVDTWTNGAVLVIDSLSALVRIAFDMQIGSKPVRDVSDWGIVQQALMSCIHKLTSGCNCHVVIIAHVERELDLILGGNKITVSVPGKAIAATILQPFSDVILATRTGDQFTWDTKNSQADLKTRNLPIEANLKPNFELIYEKWKTRALLASGGENVSV
jgi:hypothetical protein